MKGTEGLSLELTFDRLLEKLLRTCTETVLAERAVLMVDETAGLVVRATGNSLGEVTVRASLPASGWVPVSILEQVFRTGRVLVLDEGSRTKWSNSDPFFEEHHVRSALAVPVGRADHRLGVMYFENAISTALSQECTEKMRLLSAEIAVALENSLLLDERRRTESRLRILSEASAVLAESLAYETCLSKVGALVVPAIADCCTIDVLEHGELKTVMSTHGDPRKTSMLRTLHESHKIGLNSAYPQASVVRSGAPLLVGHVTDEFEAAAGVNEEYRRLIQSLEPGSMIVVPLVIRSRTYGCMVLVRSRHGKPYGTEDLAMAEELARRIAQTLENARLHRRLKRAMRQRVERDRYLRMMFRRLPGTVWTLDRNLRFVSASGRLTQDVKPRPKVGMSLYEFLGTKDPTNVSIAHHLAALSGERQSFQYQLADRWYAVLLEPLINAQGQVNGCLGVAFDITEQRTTQEHLARDEERLAEAQRVAHIGSFEWDIALNTVTWSDELHRIHGLEPGQFGGTYEAFIERVDPTDVEATKSAVFDALRNPKPFVYDHRIIRSDHSIRTLHTRGDVITDEHHKPIRVVGSCWDITDLNEAMNSLEQARSLLEATIEATADGLLVVDSHGKVAAYNRRFLTLWRIPAEIVERRDDDGLLTFVLDQLEDPDSFISGVRELYGRADCESFDVLRFRDGRVFERYSVPQRVKAGIVGRVWSFRDVTERERLFRRALFLSDATRLLASLDVEPALDSVAHLAVPYLGEGCAVDLFGYGGPRRLLVVSRDPTQPVSPDLHGSVLAGHAAVYSLGSRSCMVAPLVVKEAVVGALTFVAARKRRYTPEDLELAEELASRAALSVENANLYRGAQEALQARDEFLSIAAHEIRGPITSIHLAVQGLRKGKAPAQAMPKLLEIIEQEDRRLARFVDELLDLGNIRAGRFHLTFEEVDLGNIVREVSSRLGAELARTGSSLSITSEGHPVGQWDRFRLEQVVMNLLWNAMKFGLGKPIAVNVCEHEGKTTLVVQDHGIGIPPEMTERIFRPFERAEPVRHYGGLGLGLFIARTIVESFGGSIRVHSERNLGSTFTVELPRAKAA
jgi:signal transduction histidine kinase/PAS domain-containing protein